MKKKISALLMGVCMIVLMLIAFMPQKVQASHDPPQCWFSMEFCCSQSGWSPCGICSGCGPDPDPED